MTDFLSHPHLTAKLLFSGLQLHEEHQLFPDLPVFENEASVSSNFKVIKFYIYLQWPSETAVSSQPLTFFLPLWVYDKRRFCF